MAEEVSCSRLARCRLRAIFVPGEYLACSRRLTTLALADGLPVCLRTPLFSSVTLVNSAGKSGPTLLRRQTLYRQALFDASFQASTYHQGLGLRLLPRNWAYIHRPSSS